MQINTAEGIDYYSLQLHFLYNSM